MIEVTKVSDCTAIIKAFQKHMMSSPSEGAIVGATLPRLAAINSNSLAAAGQLKNLTDPPLPSELKSAFSESVSGGQDVGLNLPLGANNARAELADVKNWQEWLQSCIPCDLRIEFRAELLNNLDDQLLDILEQIINNYLKELAFLLNLLNASDVYGDVCPLLFAMRDICIPDLQRIISLLASILYRMSVRELNSLDLLKLLILPIFQPIFNGLLGILNTYKALITDPLNCVVSDLDSQLNKLKIGGQLNQALVDNLVEKSDAIGLTAGESGKEQARANLNAARQPFEGIDSGIQAMQDAAGSAVFHLRRLMVVGIVEIDTLLSELKSELASFLGINEKETIDFLLNQYQKLIIFRLIEFIAALIKALTVGFNCNFDNPTQAEDTVGKFLNEFLGPKAPVIVTNNSVTGDIQLIFNPELTEPLRNTIQADENSVPIITQVGVPKVSILAPSGNKEVDAAFNDIISQQSSPLTIRPGCVFEPNTVSESKLAEWLKELSATGV